MSRVFDARDADFWERFDAFMKRPRGRADDVLNSVTNTLQDVAQRGGNAVAHATLRFDRLQLDPDTLQSEKVDIGALAETCPEDVKAAIGFAKDRIAAYHERQRPQDHHFVDETGVELGWRWSAIEAVGVYVPGGRASYPSSVLMNVVPAKLAGATRVVMTAPAPDGELSPAVAYAAKIAGVDEFYPVGGAQAVAAMAYGAGSLKPVDKIVGPGNAYVAEAKRQVFGLVGIDTIAGPSEICVIADADNTPDWIAADLLSQAEHDPSAQSILITDDQAFAKAVAECVETQLGALKTEAVAREAWESFGAIVVVESLSDACDVANRIAPEHLELAVADPEALVGHIRHAGAIFLGRWTPEALGDYVTGSNHVLPTSGAARFSSGLGLFDFMKRTSIQKVTPESYAALAGPAETLAESEGLPAHARSVTVRSNR